ncbi:FAD-binding protein [Pseudaestuariivita atlantica]|uniref:2-hydroxy-acid oxidase n=1 Tax=Pseudaestuariivita atlantica TaxID=1317121 RepID=A0A0L1JQC9_9RHOB|nr:FAD-binding protein [Pseudaestuariivita atlantica]KNG93935.1 2-hydroxy-acid oxidase [Pseudaestuariivita atlantica]
MRPGTEAELAEIVRDATGPLRIVGGGTRSVGPTGGEAVSTAGLSGVRLYEPGALTLVVGAGTSLGEVETVLAGEGQALAFEPSDMRGLLATTGDSTIGGVIAANASGPRRIQAGAARDFALGVRFVDGAGEIIKNGGRVMKNVTGYDLVKLMCGSWGTLGVLTEISLKVLPAPKSRACVLVYGLSVGDAVEVMSRALGSPYEVTGAAHAPVGVDGHPVTMLRVEGFEAQVAYRAAEIAKLAGDGAVIESDPDKVAAGWAWVRDVGALQGGAGDIWRISVKPSDAATVVEAIGAEAVMLDWGGGLIWARMAEGTDLRARMHVPGHATRVRGGGDVPAFHPQNAGVAKIEAGLRARFDPRGILNPGLMA